MGLRFNKELAAAHLRRDLVAAMIVLQKEVLKEAKQDMRTLEGANDLTAETIKEIAGVIVAQIAGGPWATIDEFGTGSLMDPNNPGLANYRNSALWNPARPDNKIRGRPRGTQKTMFGNRFFKGNAPGVDLERLARAGKIDEKYLPQRPSKAIRTAFNWMRQGRFQAVIVATIQTFPWHRYIITDGR